MTDRAQSLRDTLGVAAVVLGLVFVGYELRQANLQARAAAYQAIGIATAELHGQFAGDPELAQLAVTARSGQGLDGLEAYQWEQAQRAWLQSLRLFETVQLQIEQGVLEPDALERLGWAYMPVQAWNSSLFVCLWPSLEPNVSPSVVEHLVNRKPPSVPECPVVVPR